MYKGDSPAKKMARFSYWGAVNESLGETFKTGRHLVLASEECGDISHLLARGVHARNIVAVDQKQAAINACRQRFPGVTAICDDVVNVAKSKRRQFASAFLDFCGYCGPQSLKTIVQVVAHGLSDRAVIGCGFLRGREKGSAKDSVDEFRDLHTSNMEKVYQYAVEENNGFLLEQFKGLKDHYGHLRFNEMAAIGIEAREHMAAYRIIEECAKVRCATYPYFVYSYNSGHTPMMILAHHMFRAPVGTSYEKHIEKIPYELSQKCLETFGKGDRSDLVDNPVKLVNDERLLRDLVVNTAIREMRHDPRDALKVKWLFNLTDEEWGLCVRDIALAQNDFLERAEMDNPSSDGIQALREYVCAGLGISTGTLAAWKAHRTMGNYQDKVATIRWDLLLKEDSRRKLGLGDSNE